MAQIFDSISLYKNGEGDREFDGGDVLRGKIVGLYFSAHWCPPCRAFTPILKDFHAEVGDAFEVIFVSADNSEQELASYMNEAHGDWYYLPFGDPNIARLNEMYQVSGIPSLIIIKSDGQIITTNGRGDVQTRAPSQALQIWRSY